MDDLADNPRIRVGFTSDPETAQEAHELATKHQITFSALVTSALRRTLDDPGLAAVVVTDAEVIDARQTSYRRAGRWPAHPAAP